MQKKQGNKGNILYSKINENNNPDQKTEKTIFILISDPSSQIKFKDSRSDNFYFTIFGNFLLMRNNDHKPILYDNLSVEDKDIFDSIKLNISFKQQGLNVTINGNNLKQVVDKDNIKNLKTKDYLIKMQKN